ncbi:MAG: NAD-dependent epimerase [Nevskiales bacterium]
MVRVLVTGAAGFIGCETALRLLAEGNEVVGLDNLSPYYDVRLKEARLQRLEGETGFRLERTDLADAAGLARVFSGRRFDKVVHLAAQPGVRYSLENPAAYVQSNLVGFANMLEQCRQHRVQHLVFASSSSVYGANTKLPYSVHDNVDHPISFYAATKKANELMAHSYAHLFGLPVTGLRLFTVYGPWGRPDMAPFKFLRAILNGEAIDVYNHGNMQRDFTYIDDIVEGVLRTLELIPAPNPKWTGASPDPSSSSAPYRIYNIGNHTPVGLLRFIEVLEETAGQKVDKRMLALQPGEVPVTFADVDELSLDVGFAPSTPIETGVKKLVDWYRAFYAV